MRSTGNLVQTHIATCHNINIVQKAIGQNIEIHCSGHQRNNLIVEENIQLLTKYINN